MPADPNFLQPAVGAAYPNAATTLIGCGGFACTFRVQDGANDMAVKVLDPTKVDTIREDREVIALQAVSDPRVVRYLAANKVDVGGRDFRYLAMDFVEGQPLKELFAAGHTFTLPELANLAEDIGHGAAAIWAAGLAHRDFNPGNVLVTPAGRGVIVDLGIARHMNLPTITSVAPFAGAPGWMAPEQVDANAERGDWRSDQFVIGLLLYQMATGIEPFAATNPVQRWRAPADRRLLPVRHVNPAVPRAIAAVIDQLTARQPYQRFAQAADFLDAVDLAVGQLRGATTTAVPTVAARFFIHVGATKNMLDSPFPAALAADGFVQDARNVPPANAAEWVAVGQNSGGLGLVDPVNCMDQSPAAARGAGYEKLPYGKGPHITAPFTDDAARLVYAQPIIDYEHSAGANAIIAPYLYCEPSRPDLLQESLRLGTVSARRVSDQNLNKPVWTTIAISEGWTRAASLPTLLSEITRVSPPILYVLVRTSQAAAQPLHDPEVLLGLRSLIEQVNAYGGQVIFGRRYISGLLLVALGAAGWTTGCDGKAQNMFEPPQTKPGRSGRGSDWYYVPGLLNSIKVATRAGLVSAHQSLLAPSDAYDQALFAGNLALADIGSNTQQRILLHQHNFYALRQQATALGALSQPERIKAMRQAVATAASNYQPLGAGLDAAESGDFLSAWQAVL